MAERPKIPKETRDRLLVEAKHQCSKCHEKTTHIHHVKSVADGGSNEEDNLIVLCPTCHDNVHMEHITPDQLRLYKRRWIAACRLRQMGILHFMGDAELREVLKRQKEYSRSERVDHLLGEFGRGGSSSVIDPVPQLVAKLVDIMEGSASRMLTTASVKKRLGKEFFALYRLLHRMRNNTLRIKELLDGDAHAEGEPTELTNTDMPRLIQDQAKTVFSMYKLLIDKWEFFELYVPEFSYHLWALFNCREGVLLPIAYSAHHPETESAITVFSKLDEEMMAKEFVQWVPFFSSAAHMDHYHPTVNRLYNLHCREFLTIDVSKKSAEQFRFLSAELQRIASGLKDVIGRFGAFLRNHFDMSEMLEIDGGDGNHDLAQPARNGEQSAAGDAGKPRA